MNLRHLTNFYHSPQHLSYPNGFAGDQDLLSAVSSFFNAHFKPLFPVVPDHVATAPGAAFALEALLYNICEPGDGILIPTPCWNGFDWLLTVRARVKPVFASVNRLDQSLTLDAVVALEDAFANASCPIRGVLLTNPNNPFGQCYSTETIEAIIRFCSERNIHFISDEIYALSIFRNPELPDAVPFASVLQIDVSALGCDPSRVHTIWSMSKDLGSSGLRMGCVITQHNKFLRTGIALATNTQVSSLTAIAATSLLSSPDLPKLLKLNAERLSSAYVLITSFLRTRGLEYRPATMGPFLFVKLAPNAKTWEEEARLVAACRQAGVSISGGRSYHVPEEAKGWARLNFALHPDILEMALSRLAIGISAFNASTEKNQPAF